MSSSRTRAALVTGGSRGIGAAIVERLAQDGAAVTFTYARSSAAADALVERLRGEGGEVLALQVDSTDDTAFAEAITSLADRSGGLDILVNNAGGGTFGPLAETPVSEIDTMLSTNVRALVLATRSAIPHLRPGGRIINIGSVNAERAPFPGMSIYSMTKGAVASFTRALSRELAPRGITVNNVQPGPIHTDANPSDGPGADGLRAQIPVERFGTTAEVAALVSYLAGGEAGYTTGASLTLDGGFSA